jgi:hypothetical protein
LGEELVAKVAAEEAGAAGDENAHDGWVTRGSPRA